MVEILLMAIALPFLFIALAPLMIAVSFAFGCIYYAAYGIGMLLYGIIEIAKTMLLEE